MKRTLRKLLAAAGLTCGLAFGQTAQATHYKGADLTYAYIGPDTYQVTYILYRDCMAAQFNSSYQLSIQCLNGGSSRIANMTPVGNPVNGAPYCPSLAANNACNGSSDNYQQVTFAAIVTFTAAERACGGGMVRLSIANSSRPYTRNLVGSENIYSEAIVNLGAGINNSAPLLLDLPVPYINVNHTITYSAGAYDLDGDSLAYSMRQPYSAANTPVPYQTGFSVQNPITSSPAMVFNFLTGSITVTPTVLTPGASGQGLNNYVMDIVVDEYRKMNGAMVKVGSICRDMLITVIDCGPNNNPTVSNIRSGNQTIQANDIINLKPGQPLNLQFAAADLDANSVLELGSDISSILPGATVNITSGPNPTGTITFTPTASHVRSAPYYFNLNVKDNACPVRGYQMQTIGLRVSQAGGVTGTRKEIESLTGFVAYPNPATEQVTFKVSLKKETSLQSIVIYNTLGQEVERLTVKSLKAGENNITWQNANKYAAGTYTAKLISSDKNSQTVQFSKLQ